MKFNNDHYLKELYEIAAQYAYKENRFSTVRRDFVVDPMLTAPKSEFQLDTTWCERRDSNP